MRLILLSRGHDSDNQKLERSANKTTNTLTYM